MIRHVVLMKWNDLATEESIRIFHEALLGLSHEIPEIRSYSGGSDVEVFKGNADYALVADFDNVADFKTYVFNEDHQEVIAKYGKAITESSLTAQFEI